MYRFTSVAVNPSLTRRVMIIASILALLISPIVE